MRKRIISMTLVWAMLITLFVPLCPTASAAGDSSIPVTVEDGIPGDVNGDGKINLKDAVLIYRYIVGMTVEVIEEALDFNGDGKVNAGDAFKLFHNTAGHGDVVDPRHEHKTVLIPAKAPSISASGNIAYYYCSGCGKCFSEANAWNEIAPETIIISNTASVGLEFALNEDGNSYSVVGKGTCTDTNIVIPAVYNNKPVTEIGMSAFQDRYSLTGIVIPDGVVSIGDSAFEGCYLTSVDIPDSVTSIGKQAFYYCYELTGIHIPSGVKSIGVYAFSGCPLTSITVDKDNEVYSSNGNCLIETAEKTLVLGCVNSVIPSDGSVTRIGDDAFYALKITSIELPDGITEIGNYSFSNCSKLENILLSEGLTKIGEGAFNSCSKLTSISIPSSVNSIGTNAFRYCSALSKISVATGNKVYSSAGNCLIDTVNKELLIGLKDTVIPSDGSVTRIGDMAFYGRKDLTAIVLPDSITYIGEQAFRNCSDLTSINIPNGVTELGIKAFSNCTGLQDVSVPGSVSSIGDDAFYGCRNIKTLFIAEGVERIGIAAFSGCDSLTDVTIPSSMKTIEVRAFKSCLELKIVYISDLTSWCDITFAAVESNPLNSHKNGLANLYLNNQRVLDLIIPDGVTEIKDYAFYECSIRSIDIPDSVISIGNYAFYGTSVQDISIGRGVSSIGECAFDSSVHIDSLTVDPDNKTFHVESNCIIDTSNKELVVGFSNGTIPSDGSVTSIGNYAFMGSRSGPLTIPGTVTRIGNHAFEFSWFMSEIIIPSSVQYIGASAFMKCSDLESIVVEEGNAVYHSNGNCLIETDTKRLIAGCVNSVIPSDGSVTEIAEYAFAGHQQLTEITIPKTVIKIGHMAFADCYNIKSITYTGTLEEWRGMTKAEIWHHSHTNLYCTDGTIYGLNEGNGFAPPPTG